MADYDTKSKVKEVSFPDTESGIQPVTSGGANGAPISADQLEQDTKPAPVTPTPATPTVSNTSGLKNADVNFNQYGDDSSAPNQAQAGGMNEKFTGEGVKTSNVNYDPNAKFNTLDPNYQYGMSGQYANSDSAGYLARRNDQIASALWNEYKGNVSKESVIQYLASQNGWNNSTEADRVNTVEAVWKRIGEIAGQQEQPEQAKEEGVVTDASGVDQIKEDLAQKGGTIYGKDTADEKTKIKTNVDEMSVEADIARSRANKLDFLRTMDSASIAASIVSGTIPYGDQAFRDLETYYPEKAAEVRQIEKQIRGQMAVDDIANGETDYVSSSIDSKKEQLETTKKTMAEEYAESAEDVAKILKDIDSTLESNEDAKSAEGTMAAIEADINKLKTRLKNLRKEANSVFKGDVPDYIVRAYIANRTSEINDKLQELQYSYNAAYERYQTDLNNAWKQKEYDLKVRQVKLQEDQFEFNKQKQSVQNNQVVYQDGEWFTITYNQNNIPTVRKSVVVQEYPNSGMKGQALHNNNPGNITDTTFGNVIGVSSNGMAQFATPEDGFDALVEKVKYNQTNPNSGYYGMDIWDYFHKYAPERDRNGNKINDPDGYATSVANNLGVGVHTKIADLDPIKFAAEIAHHECNYDYSTYGQFRSGASGGGDTPMGSVEVDFEDIVVPDYVFNQNGTTVDRESDEGKQLALDYRKEYVEKNKGTLFARVELDGEGGKAYKMIANDSDIPLDYRQVIYNMVPTKMKDSDQQLAQLYSDIKRLWNLGYNKWEAGLMWYGIDVSKDKTGLAWPLIDQTRILSKELSDTYYGDLNSKLDRNDVEGAVKKVELEALGGEGGAGNEAERDAIERINKANQVLAKLKAMADAKGLDSVGIIGGTVSKKLSYLFNEEEYVGLAADIANLFPNEYKNAGDDVGGIGGLLRTYTPVANEPVSNIVAKINAYKNDALQRANSYRAQVLLPILTEEQLLDAKLRGALYLKRERQRQLEAQFGEPINKAN